MQMSNQLHAPAVLHPGKNPLQQLKGRWFGLDVSEKKSFVRDRNPAPDHTVHNSITVPSKILRLLT